MRPRTCFPIALLLLALAAGAPEPSASQLRPDRESLQTAERLKSRRASASDIARELKGLRRDDAMITATLFAVGYRDADVGKAHAEALRLDADASAATTMKAMNDAALAFNVLSVVARDERESSGVARTRLRLSAGQVLAARKESSRTTTKAAAASTAQAPSANRQPPSISSSAGVTAEPAAPPPCNAAV